MNNKNILSKLHKIEKEKCIYDIHYCKAGIGFIFYELKKDKGDWKSALEVDEYYPTFEEAVEKEFERLK